MEKFNNIYIVQNKTGVNEYMCNYIFTMTQHECTLDISNVSHSTSVVIDGDSCMSKSEPTAVLRDVSARVHGGEVLAVLGSKGSGKRALLDVIGI